MSFWEYISSFIERSTEESKLTDQFFVTLRANFQQCKKIQDDKYSKIVEKVVAIFNKKNKTWKDAYEIERLMVVLYDEKHIEVELTRRLVEAERSLFLNEYECYKEQVANLTDTSTADDRKPILDRLINDLQWRYTLNQLKRVFSQNIRTTVSFVFIVSTIIFFVTLTNITDCKEFYLLIAIATGFWGASFSMIVTINDRLKNSGIEELRLLRRFSYILSRVAIGIGASLILCFFLQVGMLSGSIFPDMAAITTSLDPDQLNGKDLSLFVIWSFIAGFSEKFVPNLLSKTEQKANQTS